VTPTSVKIGLYNYHINWYNKEYRDTCGEDGYTFHDTQTIGIYEGLPPVQTAEIFLHELFHVVNVLFSVGKDSTEEQQVTAASRGLVMVLMDNPGVHSWFTTLLTRSPKD